jgi:endonuclease-3 related protein
LWSSTDYGHKRAVLTAIYDALSAHYGPQRWWPTRSGSAWEIMLGAVLTQRTTWRNVELALDNVEEAWGLRGLSEPEIILNASNDELVSLLRPTGHYKSKPRRVQGLARFVIDAGGVQALVASTAPTGSVRERLLSIWGIGPETADAILLYALGRPMFVADAYALRLASRWGLLGPRASYSEIQRLFMDHLPHDAALFNEYHALIVAHGKAICRPRPLCEVCILNQPIRADVISAEAASWRCPRLIVDH